MIRKHSKIALLSLISALAPLTASYSAEPPLDLKWAQLVPPKPAELAAPAKPKSFFSAVPSKAEVPSKADDGSPAPPPMADAKFMSMKRRQPGGDAPPAVVADLNGKLVSIGGYIVPLDFESTTIKEFLLVPFVGACIHVPPPPANQIIYVKSEKGIEITGQFDPVTVKGTLKTETAFTGLADAGYSLTADSVEILKPQ
jgi:uncharacterized protein